MPNKTGCNIIIYYRFHQSPFTYDVQYMRDTFLSIIITDGNVKINSLRASSQDQDRDWDLRQLKKGANP